MKPLPRHLKRWHLEEMLEQGMVMVHLDARRKGVSVPSHLASDTHLRLNLSYHFKPCDLEVVDDEASVTLSFGGRPWLCRLPYKAIFGLTSHVTGESLMWVEDMPEELVDALASLNDGGPCRPAQSVTASSASPRLRAIDGEGKGAEPPSQHSTSDQSVVRLRVVK